jgi:hypothetical protein
MTDRPIIFSAPMIRALLGGHKTQTRRVIKLNGRLPEYGGPSGCTDDPSGWGWEDSNHGDWITLRREPGQRMGWLDWRGAYTPGDRLWVREAFCPRIGWPAPVAKPHYRADDDRPEWSALWKPSIHMPRWASRLTLTVTDVRVQRLQDISNDDALEEGCECYADGWRDYQFPSEQCCGNGRDSFRTLWDSLHGPDAWAFNPWVVALTFTVNNHNIDKMPGSTK